MKKYLVGGAVRDTLLNLPIKEKDWVIVGSTPQEMLKIGYLQVGKDFPVFLHPDNHEEYALARTERKSGIGYTGFSCYTSPSITIEEDLYRRDLTINAMAYDKHGNLIDPYNGQKDMQLRILRHVSHTFHEDPLRILRVARFSAQFAHMKFTIAPETLLLMKQMIHELLYISPERIWIETKKALITKNPQIYFDTLRQCGALKILFPELDILFNIPQKKTPISTHQLTSTNLGHYTMIQLNHVATFTDDIAVRFSILCQHLGKNITHYQNINPQLNYQSYYNYGILKNTPLTTTLCNRLKIPHNINNLANLVSKYYKYLSNYTLCIPEMLMTLFTAFDCWRKPQRIEQMIFIGKSKELKHKNHDHNHPYSQKFFLHSAFKIVNTVRVQDIIRDGFTGPKINLELYSRRLNVLKTWFKTPLKNPKNDILNH